MLLLMLCAYAGAIYAIFFKLGWLRWTLPWRVITIGLPIVVLGLLMIWFRLVVPGAVPADGSTYLAADVEQVIPLTSGPVKTVSIKEDKPVKKGQPLFSIDPEPLQQTLTQAKSKPTQAEEAYRQARALVKAGGVSRRIGNSNGILARRARERLPGAPPHSVAWYCRLTIFDAPPPPVLPSLQAESTGVI